MNREKILSALISIGLTVMATFAFAKLSTEVFEVYGSGVFIVTPFVCGAVSVLIYNRKGRKRIIESLSVALIGGCVSLLAFFAAGFEGLICLAMSIPVVLPLFLLGGLLGFVVSRAIGKRLGSDFAALILVALVPLFMGFESRAPKAEATRSVVTKVVISGSIENVWNEVIAFSPIPEPEELLFRMGIAYPTHAKIEGEGVGAIRYCAFSTGSFVEPITHWDENHRLAFNVAEQPVPMTEISPYLGIHPPHLDWAIQSERGEFLLSDLGDGTVELTGTTWFHTVMSPEPYWGWLSDEMIRLIHKRVLNHIKQTVESDAD